MHTSYLRMARWGVGVGVAAIALVAVLRPEAVVIGGNSPQAAAQTANRPSESADSYILVDEVQYGPSNAIPNTALPPANPPRPWGPQTVSQQGSVGPAIQNGPSYPQNGPSYPGPTTGSPYGVAPTAAAVASPTPVPTVTSGPEPIALPANPHGLPQGSWTRQSVGGKATISVEGRKITITFEGSGELAMIRPTAHGEFSVASDGTVYGLFHSVDAGLSAAASDLDISSMALNGISDVPFSMRVYTSDNVLAIKQISVGVPYSFTLASDGDFAELPVYVSMFLTGAYAPQNTNSVQYR